MKRITNKFLYLILVFLGLSMTAPSVMALPATFHSEFIVNLTFPQQVANVFNYTVTDPSNSFTNGTLTAEIDLDFYSATSKGGIFNYSSKGFNTTFSLVNLSAGTYNVYLTGTQSYNGTVDLTDYDLSLYGEYGFGVRSNTRNFGIVHNYLGFRDQNVEAFNYTGPILCWINMPAHSQYDMWVEGGSFIWTSPEPATMLLLGLGLIGLAGVRRKLKE
jgi:hypothetical protein